MADIWEKLGDALHSAADTIKKIGAVISEFNKNTKEKKGADSEWKESGSNSIKKDGSFTEREK